MNSEASVENVSRYINEICILNEYLRDVCIYYVDAFRCLDSQIYSIEPRSSVLWLLSIILNDDKTVLCAQMFIII